MSAREALSLKENEGPVERAIGAYRDAVAYQDDGLTAYRKACDSGAVDAVIAAFKEPEHVAVDAAQKILNELQGEYRELSGFNKAKRARWYSDDTAWWAARYRIGSAIKQAQAALYLAQGKAGIAYIDMSGCDTAGD